MVVPFGCIHSRAEQHIAAQMAVRQRERANWLKWKWENSALLSTGFCLAEASKKCGVKTFRCSHCDKKFGLFWQEFLKLEDMKTQTVWCQNAVSLNHLGKEIQGPIAVNLFMFLQNRFFLSIDLSFLLDKFNFNFSEWAENVVSQSLH